MKKRMSRTMLGKSNVHGIGVGYHDPKNPKKGAAVIIYTNKTKITSKFLGLSSTLTMTAKGKSVTVPVRFVKSGKIRAYVDYKARIRPIPAGYSIGTQSGSGSVGLIVTDASMPRQRYMISNNHVLNPTNSCRMTRTLQPGGADGGQIGLDTVGRLFRYVKLERNKSNRVDIALSKPVRNSLLSPRYPTVGVLPGYVTTYRIGDRLKKVGRTTGVVHGIVDSVNTDIQIDYGELGNFNFKNQTVVRGVNPVSLPGDSGSVWLRTTDNYAAAMNFAGSSDGRVSISFPVQWAMQIFGTQIARPKGLGTVKKVKTKHSPESYAPQLTSKELALLRVLRAKYQKRRT